MGEMGEPGLGVPSMDVPGMGVSRIDVSGIGDVFRMGVQGMGL